MKKKTIIIRVKKIAPKRFLIEQKRKFLWFWEFWQKGCPTLGLKKLYATKLAAKTAIQSKADKKGVRTVIIFL
jgi:hypothetical protein